LVRTIAEVLAQLGATRAFVVHGAGGIDELSPAGPNFVCEVANGGVRARNIDPLEFGLPRCDPSDLRGGSPAENAAAIRAVFAGENGGRRRAVLLHAAGAVAAGGHADGLGWGLELARGGVASGEAVAPPGEIRAAPGEGPLPRRKTAGPAEAGGSRCRASAPARSGRPARGGDALACERARPGCARRGTRRGRAGARGRARRRSDRRQRPRPGHLQG